MNSADSVRAGYVEHGVEGYYARFGAEYRNPHEAAVREAIALAHVRAPLPLGRILDLACGSGEAALALLDLGAEDVTGCDPYTAAAWRARVDRPILPHTFADVAAGALDARPRFDLIVCSFALHLAERSRLPGITWALARASRALLILSPHKRPAIDVGFTQTDAFAHRRVRARRFDSRI